MKKEENGRQLKLSERNENEEVVNRKKGKSKRNKVRDRWVVFGVLFVTVVVSLGFYLVSSGGRPVKKEKTKQVEEVEKQGDGLFGSAVHEF